LVFDKKIHICILLLTGELGMVDEAQKAMEEAEALKKVRNFNPFVCTAFSSSAIS